VTGIAGGLGGFLNDVWNSYAGNDRSFGRQFGNEQFDAEGNPVQWNPNAPYETAFNDRVAQILAERGATAPPQGQDPTSLISDDAWANQQALREAIQQQTGGGGTGGGGSNGQYGFQMPPQMLQQLMPQNMNLGGNPPQPPGGGNGAITTPPDNGGFTRNAVPTQEVSPPTNEGFGRNGTPPVDPLVQAMLAQLMGGGMDANTLAQTPAPLPGPNDPASRTNNTQTGYPTGEPVMPMQGTSSPSRPTGGYMPSPGMNWDNGVWYDGQGRVLGYAATPNDPPGAGQPHQPTENEMLNQSEQVGRGVYAGASDAYVPPTPSGSVGVGGMNVTANGISGGPYVVGMADRTAQPSLEELLQIMGQQQGRNPYNVTGMNVSGGGMGGGITAPPLANPNPNQDDYLPQSEQTGRGTAVGGTLSDRLGTTSQAPEDQWWYHDIFDHSNQDDYLPQSEQTGRGTTVGGTLGDRLGTTPQSWDASADNLVQGMAPNAAPLTLPAGAHARSWWQENMTPSWWRGAMGGGSDASAWPPSRSSDQQVRIGKPRQTPATASPGRPGTAGSRSSYKPPYTQNAEQQRGADEYMRIYHQRQEQNRRAGVGSGAYGRAAAIAYLMQQQGITPASTQLAARRSTTNAFLGM
jgi:hypothetical protein